MSCLAFSAPGWEHTCLLTRASLMFLLGRGCARTAGHPHRLLPALRRRKLSYPVVFADWGFCGSSFYFSARHTKPAPSERTPTALSHGRLPMCPPHQAASTAYLTAPPVAYGTADMPARPKHDRRFEALPPLHCPGSAWGRAHAPCLLKDSACLGRQTRFRSTMSCPYGLVCRFTSIESGLWSLRNGSVTVIAPLLAAFCSTLHKAAHAHVEPCITCLMGPVPDPRPSSAAQALDCAHAGAPRRLNRRGTRWPRQRVG